MNTSHLVALQTRLSHERGYLAAARSENERALRKVWVVQIEREIECEYKHLGIAPVSNEFDEMSDEDLLAALTA